MERIFVGMGVETQKLIEEVVEAIEFLYRSVKERKVKELLNGIQNGEQYEYKGIQA